MLNGARYFHKPVLLAEVLASLNPKPGENYIDATFGGGGYAGAILEKVQPDGQVLAIDLDSDAIKQQTVFSKQFSAKNLVLHHGNFKDIDKIAKRHKFKNIKGIVADLGLSSYELDQSGRGFSFQKKELLDMRFDQKGDGTDAKYIVNHWDEKDLTKIFREFGEEKFSRQVARKVIEIREKRKEIKYTADLYEIIKDALPKPVKHKSDSSARRVFQALRIAVNHELENLEEFLPKAFNILAPKGRLVVVTFHSLEDRIVKQYFNSLAKACVCPPDFPICKCGQNSKGKILNKKPITVGEIELKENSRGKPAKLRAIEKI